MAPRTKKEMLVDLQAQLAYESEPADFEYVVHTEERGRIQNKRGRKPYRPNLHDPGILDKICDKLMEGHGLFHILDPKNMPSARSVYRELATNPNGEFARRIAYAREVQHVAIMDHCHSLASKTNPDNANAMKVKLDWFKWHQARLHPQMYGDKIQHDITQRNARPIELTRDEYDVISLKLIEGV